MDYLAGGGSEQSIAVEYVLHAESTVLKWVKQYNSHEELTDSRKTGGYLITKDNKRRKTSICVETDQWHVSMVTIMITGLY